ncbi:DUF2339 domain-containing protein [bacterium]|nr:DUF2339 domain-containing protein [bacterium]
MKPSSSVRNRKMRLGEKIAAYLPFDRSTGNNKTTQKLSTNSLEVFMGARLFAWIGGLAFFFAICFFVKYSFDNNLVPPWLRIALGYITSTALLGGGLFLNRKPYKITSHTLCGTGIVGLYAVIVTSQFFFIENHISTWCAIKKKPLYCSCRIRCI